MDNVRDNDIAIIGMGCRFPGADNPEAFWDLLAEGRSAVTEVPADRWDLDRLYSSQPHQPFKTNSRWGGFLSGIEQFDPEFFGITPREAETLDPQQRLLLEVAWESLESAGVVPETLAGTDTGVFVGACKAEYWDLHKRSSAGYVSSSVTGADLGMLPNRISYTLDLRGPSIVLDTLCSSSLVSVHYACQSLKQGECNLALAGGVNLVLLPDTAVALSQSQALSPTGGCKTFDKAADGYVRGEGCGLVILKRYEDAIRDGDRVLAVVRGSAINQDGRSNGISAPSRFAQKALLERTYASSGVDLEHVSYLECHGTGTPLGDPIEVNAIRDVFGSILKDEAPLTLGAAKANIGHLEAAAGIAGLIKLVLMMKHHQIPAQPNLVELNPRININGLNICSELSDWPTVDAGVRVAAISAFSFGGVNAHLVLQQPEAAVSSDDQSGQPISDAPTCLTLSAHHEHSLRELASSYAALLRRNQVSLNQIVEALNTWRKNDYPHRIACTGRNNAEVAAALMDFAADPTVVTPGLWRRGSYSKRQKIAFLFTGQGSQYPGMGKTLYSQYESFRTTVDRCAAYLLHEHNLDVVPVLFSNENAQDIHNTLYTQPALFVYEYALSQLLAEHGVKPDVVMGHSIGEYVAACVAGSLSLENALTLITLRARGMANQCEPGAMLAVFSSPDKALSAIGSLGNELDIAALNAPELFVFSGSTNIIEKTKILLEENGMRSRRLDVSHAFHSRMMEPMLPDFVSALEDVPFYPPKLALISNVTGKIISPHEITPSYWAEHIRQPVNFSGSVRELEELKVTTVVEVGPAAVLSGLCRQCELSPGIAVVPAVRTSRDEQESFVEALAQLFVAGCTVKPPTNGCEDALAPGCLPLYPFNRRPFWLQGLSEHSLTPTPFPVVQSGHALLGACIDVAGTRDRYYQSLALNDLSRYLEDHRVDDTVVLAGAAYVDLMLTALKKNGLTQYAIEGVELLKPLLLTEDTCLQTRIRFSSESNSFQQCEIWAKERDSSWQRYARANVLPGSFSKQEAPSADQGSGLNVAEHYQWLRSIGLDYGARFQGLRTAQLQDGVAVGSVDLPEQTEKSAESVIHPVLLDSALHLVTVLIRQQVMPTMRLVPASIRTAWFDGANRDSVTVAATITEVADASGAVNADIHFYDESNRCVGACLGVRAVPMGKIEREKTVPVYQPVWVEQAPTQPQTLSHTCNRLVVAAPDRIGLARSIASLSGEETQIVLLNCAKDQPAIDDVTLVDTNNSIAFAELLRDCNAISEVILLSPGQRESGDAEIASAESLFLFFKAWLTSPLAERTNLSLKLATTMVQAVTSDDKTSANGSSWVGLTGVFSSESGNIRCAVVDIDKIDNEEQIEKFLSEPGHTRNPAMVAYRKQQRLIRQIKPSHMPKPRPALKLKGVYVVLGGAGGIGRLLSEELSSHYHANIIWLGRRPKNAEIEASMAEVTALGGQVTYLQLDATDTDALANGLKYVRETFGAINGVVHASAVVEDRALVAMSDEQLRKALLPKINTAVNLAEATKNDALDIFAFYSSAASFGFSAGQANYVAGGTFIDAFSRELAQQGVPAITINWGYWGELGVSDRKGLAKLMRAQGIEPISAEEGRSMLLPLLNAELGQAMPIKASDELLAQWGLPVDAAAPAHPEHDLPDAMLQQLSEVGRLDKAQSCDCILGFLKLQVARIMKSRESDIDSPANPFKQLSLSAIGFESLMIMDLRGRIQRYLDVTLSSEDLLKKEDMGQIAEAVYEQVLLRQLSTEEEEKEGSDMETFVI